MSAKTEARLCLQAMTTRHNVIAEQIRAITEYLRTIDAAIVETHEENTIANAHMAAAVEVATDLLWDMEHTADPPAGYTRERARANVEAMILARIDAE